MAKRKTHIPSFKEGGRHACDLFEAAIKPAIENGPEELSRDIVNMVLKDVLNMIPRIRLLIEAM